MVVPENSSSDGRRKAVAPTGVKVVNSTACSSQCSCARNVWRRPVKAAGGAHWSPSMRHLPRKENAATGLVSGRCAFAVKRGKFHHKEALDERPQGWTGGLLKNLHHVARVRLHAFIRMREVSACNSRSSAASDHSVL